MGTDVCLSDLSGRNVTDLPTCRGDGWRVWEHILGEQPYQGERYPLSNVMERIRSRIRDIRPDDLIAMDSITWAMLDIYRILDGWDLAYLVRFH